MEQSSVGYPLLLLDNETLAYILGDGAFRFANLTFDEAKMCIRDRNEAPYHASFLDFKGESRPQAAWCPAL